MSNKCKVHMVPAILLVLLVWSCQGKKSHSLQSGNMPAEWQQQKETPAGRISMLLLSADGEKDKKEYRFRLMLQTKEPVKQPTLMKYMNFDIRSSFWTIRGTDTMPCAICERVPGIRETDFTYLLIFRKHVRNEESGAHLQLHIIDTLMGFGQTNFIISNEALKKLER